MEERHSIDSYDGSRHNWVALGWVQDDIALALTQARQSLEAHVAGPGNEGYLKDCLKLIHQVRCALEMVEFEVPVTLAEEMERLVQAFQDNSLPVRSDTYEALVRAMAGLPVWLKQLQFHHRESIAGGITAINDLRSVRGESLLSETTVFSPDLKSLTPPVSEAELARFQGESLGLLLKKLRQMYQFALVGFFNNPGDSTHQNYLVRVFERMSSLCSGMPSSDLWSVALALVQGVKEGEVNSGPAIRNLLRQIDKVLAEAVGDLPLWFNRSVDESLLKNCLYYVTCSLSDDRITAEIKQRYNLYQALPENPGMDEDVANRDLTLASEKTINSDKALTSEEALALKNLQSAQRAVLQEACTGIKQARSAASELISSGWNREVITQVPDMLAQVHGALDIIGQSRLSSLAKAARHYVEAVLLQSAQQPDWQELENFADVLSATEYLLERLKQDDLDRQDSTLSRAEESLTRLRVFDQGDNTAAPEFAIEQPIEQPIEPEQLYTELNQDLYQNADDETVSYGELDQEFIEIFSEEAREIRQLLHKNMELWRFEPANHKVLKNLRRGFHTLKGSGRMAGAVVIGDLSWAVENMLNGLLEEQVRYHSAMAEVVDAAISLLPGLIDEYICQSQQISEDVRSCIRVAEALSRGEALSRKETALSRKETALSREETALSRGESLSGKDKPDIGLDPELIEIFSSEAGILLQELGVFIDSCNDPDAGSSRPITDELLHSLHTLKGSASMAGVSPVVEIATALEHLARELRTFGIEADDETASLIMRGVILIQLGLEQLDSTPFQRVDGTDEWLEEINGLINRYLQEYDDQEGSFDTAELFQEVSLSFVLDAGIDLASWNRNPSDPFVSQICDSLLTLAGNARLYEQDVIGDLAEELAVVYQVLQEKGYPATDEDVATLAAAHERLINMLDELAGQQTPRVCETTLVSLQRLIDGIESTDHSARPLTSDDDEHAPELLAVFLDEAMDNLDAASKALYRWLEDDTDGTSLTELQRHLHTIKGGARMAGIRPIGDLGHELEGVYEALKLRRLKVSQDLIHLLMSSHDALEGMLGSIRSNNECRPAKKLCKALRKQLKNLADPELDPGLVSEDIITAHTESAETVAVSNGVDPAEHLQDQQMGAERIAAPAREYLKKEIESAVESSNDEQVRVPADLLDRLVSLAAETSISRSRIEQQINDFSYTLKEMHTTIDRLQEQLRRLDTETHTQIISRHESEETADRNFDPLEMDRYSELTQLSRSLVESATDLKDLKQVLEEKSRDSETLLLQQSRINTELQEGLLRTRMLPFERILPRLRRVVRQVSEELGKQVELKVVNAEGEMDRTVMERMIPPLEHMLRNAIDHGVESSPEIRIANGKREVAEISLNFVREGGEFVLSLADDGLGVDLNAVRDKAVERGLLREEEEISDNDISRMILRSGFSTANTVTQISGRGVGMDVVQNELKQLGGRIDIHSTEGQGTEFEIRLPFTQAINRALMVNLEEEQYAIPLNILDGVVRLSPFELEGHYQVDDSGVEHDGQFYHLHYLGDLLYGQRPQLDNSPHELPVLLIKLRDKNIAVQVDSLVGSREVVVKSLGPQFAAVRGVSGATILGDGRVVVILDMVALLVDYLAREPNQPVQQAQIIQEQENNLIMVVDDSVTVRKVTTRLLKRNGYRTASARDGVEAMALLQEYFPAAILLDIEMPRMDGFEVATAVRNDPELKDIPIIMVTSRTGEKHRQKAQEIGVNEYLGKPFQEGLLLETIGCFVKRHD